MTIDNWGIGFADDFKYNYTEVRLFKGFIKISAEGAQQLSIIHCQLSICDKPYLLIKFLHKCLGTPSPCPLQAFYKKLGKNFICSLRSIFERFFQIFSKDKNGQQVLSVFWFN